MTVKLLAYSNGSLSTWELTELLLLERQVSNRVCFIVYNVMLIVVCHVTRGVLSFVYTNGNAISQCVY